LPFEIDHIIPLKLHGLTRADNLALACFHCNNAKGALVAGIDPDTLEVVRLFRPRSDVWKDHFVWHGPVLHAKLNIGRITVDVLEINDPLRVAWRELLIEEGVGF
jgi:hypothetical protein